MTAFLNPRKILEELELRPDMTAADFGCGSGHWTISLAEKLKAGEVYGIVYGIDILEEPLSVLHRTLRARDLPNIRIVRGNLERENGSTLPDNFLDLVLATNLFFQIENKREVMKEIKRVLKSRGQVLVVDWLPETPLGPKEGRVLPQDIKMMAGEFGFEVKKEFKAGPYHWGMVLAKK